MFKDQWNSIEENDFHFTSNPLHLRMLTEVIYVNKFEFNPENFGLLNLFDEFVKIKFRIYYELKAKLGNCEAAEELCKRDSDDMRKTHCAEAVKMFTDGKTCYKLPNLQFQPSNKQEYDRIGFLKLDEEEGQLKFLHRSYAEYFCSIYLIDNQTNERVNDIARTLIKKDDYKLLRQFYEKSLENNRTLLT